MRQAANTDLFNPLHPKAYKSECQNLLFPSQIKALSQLKLVLDNLLAPSALMGYKKLIHYIITHPDTWQSFFSLPQRRCWGTVPAAHLKRKKMIFTNNLWTSEREANCNTFLRPLKLLETLRGGLFLRIWLLFNLWKLWGSQVKIKFTRLHQLQVAEVCRSTKKPKVHALNKT